MAQELQVGATGAVIYVTVTEDDARLNISSVTSKSLVFRKPNQRATITKPASFVTDGTDGKLYYVTESGFLDRAGQWEVQAYLQFPGGGYDGRGEIEKFTVKANL